MSIQKSRANYTAVNLPKELLDLVDARVKKDNIFRSRAEYIKYLIMQNLELR